MEDGSISNIGNVCGADEDKFSTKFLDEKQKFSDAERRAELLPRLLDRRGLQEIEREVRAAYSLAQAWIRRCEAFAALFPEAYREIRRRSASGESLSIMEVVERTQAEITDMVSSGLARNRAGARYKEVEKGVLQGVNVLDLNEKQMSTLWRRADALLASDPQGAEVAELQELFQETHYLPTDARRTIAACEAGRLFFSPTNFRLMTFLPMSSNAKSMLAKLTVATLDSHIPKHSSQGPADGATAGKTSRRERDALKKLAAIKRDAERLKR
ncbi:hypothetical protein CJU94_19560 [Paraburkholderia aromaticivorans]|uniref:Uncharacterized protein n=1 Tax=Paraburkholderia aromaticivorans TaxID=2026199 RepID=A0A248VMD6_9BURK|nr:hypothetical protein CJU94_19560 [Paraburkholderia aromaticivorans]